MRALRRGDRVRVPWSPTVERYGRVLEVWGDPRNPSQIKIEFDRFAEDDAPTVRLLSPTVVSRADVA